MMMNNWRNQRLYTWLQWIVEGWEYRWTAVLPHLVYRLYRRFRSIWCPTCALCIGTTPYLIFARHSLYIGWTQVWKEWVESLNVDGMLVQSCGAMRTSVMKSTMEHTMAAICSFANKRFGKGMEIGYYSDTLIYTSLYGNEDVERR